MARGLEAGSFLFGLEVEEEEGGGMTWLLLLMLLLLGKKKKGRGVQLGCRVERVCEGWMTWDGRIGCLFFNIILFVSVSCERLLLTSMKRKRASCSSLFFSRPPPALLFF